MKSKRPLGTPRLLGIVWPFIAVVLFQALLGWAVSRNKCNSQLIFLSMLITKLGIPASETSLPLGV